LEKEMNIALVKRAKDFFASHSNGNQEVNIEFYGNKSIINFSLKKRILNI
jgi:hypothetical protein